MEYRSATVTDDQSMTQSTRNSKIALKIVEAHTLRQYQNTKHAQGRASSLNHHLWSTHMEIFITTLISVVSSIAIKLVLKEVASQASEAVSEASADESVTESFLDFFFD
jgi:hypothetical protein